MNLKGLCELKQRVWHRIRRLREGLDTPRELFVLCAEYVWAFVSRQNAQQQFKAAQDRLERKYLALSEKYKTDGAYSMKGARLPLMTPTIHTNFWGYVFEDIFWTYLKHGDCYEESVMRSYYDLLLEGPYCLKNDIVDVTVNQGDIVIDAGSWIGDFAAYASAKGALTYAFEPSEIVYDYLLKTAELNKGIYPVKKGLGNIETAVRFTSNTADTAGNAILDASVPDSGEQFIQTTTIDNFVEEERLSHVDFIKADIEGYERYMLEGARKTLKKYAPKLAICTYHLPDDPDVLTEIIKDANPAYKIVQKKKKLYASV